MIIDNRFLYAQDNRMEGYETALSEISAGRKVSHWMWYIFPQLSGLGRSCFSNYYGISGIEEARAYLAHEVLGKRLREISETLLAIEGKSAEDIFGPVDAMKLRSCMTLFDLVERFSIFRRVLDKYFAGESDTKTVKKLIMQRDVLSWIINQEAVIEIYGKPEDEAIDTNLIEAIKADIETVNASIKSLDYYHSIWVRLQTNEDRDVVFASTPLCFYASSSWYGEICYGWNLLAGFELDNTGNLMLVVDDYRSLPPDGNYCDAKDLPNWLLRGVLYLVG